MSEFYFLCENLGRMLSGKFAILGKYTYFIWGARMGGRQITKVETDKINDPFYFVSHDDDIGFVDKHNSVVLY